MLSNLLRAENSQPQTLSNGIPNVDYFDRLEREMRRINTLRTISSYCNLFCQISFAAAGVSSIYLASQSDLSQGSKAAICTIAGLTMLGSLYLCRQQFNALREQSAVNAQIRQMERKGESEDSDEG